MIHFLAFYVKRLKKAHFKEFYSTKRSTFQNIYANRLKSKNFYSIKSAHFRISMQMKIHLRGANPPPPPYRNNLYKITYVINFSRYSLKIREGGFNPPNLSTASSGGGGLRPPPQPSYFGAQLFIYSFILNGISIYFCTDPLYMYMFITTLNRNDMCI